MIKRVQELLNPKHLVQNSYLFGVLSIFLVMYGPRLQPALPNSLRNVFDNSLFRGIVIFLILYLSSKNIQLSLVICVIFLVTMNLLHMDNIKNLVESEGFTINGPALNSNCYNNKSLDLIGTLFYPLNDNDKLREMRNDEDYPQYNGEVNYEN
jgi:hypothetical protein